MSGTSPRLSIGRVVALTTAAFVTGLAVRGLITDQSPGRAADVAAAQGDTSAAAGPRNYADGVPAGFTRTSDGARAAAVHFVLVGRELVSLESTRLADAVRAMAASGSADEQVTDAQARLSQLRDRLAAGSGPIRYVQAVLASRVDAFTSGRARVSVWSVGVLSRVGVAQPQAGWTTSTFELVWERDDWRIWDQSIAPGPTPAPNGAAAPTSAEQLEQALIGFTPWQGAP